MLGDKVIFAVEILNQEVFIFHFEIHMDSTPLDQSKLDPVESS